MVHHVVAVHNQQQILLRNVFRALHPGVDVVEQDVVEVSALAVDLPWLLHAVADVVHIPVTCTATMTPSRWPHVTHGSTQAITHERKCL